MAQKKQDYICLCCKDILQDPVLLPCLHSFCRNCVRHSPKCPDKLCTEKIPNDINSIPESPIHANIINSYNKILELAQKGIDELFCDDCFDDPPKNAIYFCLDCRALMCRADYESHQNQITMMRSKKHVQVRLEDSDHLDELVIKPMDPIFKCTAHGNETEVCCKIDGEYLCRECRDGEHRGHMIRDLDYTASDMKDDLARDIGKMTRGKENEIEIKKYYEQKLLEMYEDEKNLVTNIENEFNSKISALETHRDNLMEQVRELSKHHQNYMKDLMARQEGLIDKLNEFKVLTRPYLYEYPVTYILEVMSPIRERIQQLDRELHPDEATEPKKIQFVVGKLREITTNPEKYGSISKMGRSSLSFTRPPRLLFGNSKDDPMKPNSVAVNDRGQAFVLRTPVGSSSRYCLDSVFPYNLGNTELKSFTEKDAGTATVRFSGKCSMAVSKKGKIAIADIKESNIYIFNIDFLYSMTIKGNYKKSGLVEPNFITFSSEDQLLVASGYNSVVLAFNAHTSALQLDAAFIVEQMDIELYPRLPNKINPIVNMAVNSNNHILLLLHLEPWFRICDFEGKDIPTEEYQILHDMIDEIYKPRTKIRTVYRRYDTPLLREKALLYVDCSDNVYIYYNSVFAVYNSHYKEVAIYPAADIEEPISMACDNLNNVYFCTESNNALVYGSI
ncbi:E3 ubiquitin/ISG15 ligase TRIM25-like [Oopsacas minuta]|uniref:E3 ubiquitin/ISG15 ligase TRIM25-like n=1 Tax=Oopsacas minuta TaxID=111878 RepID=A0AAV7KAY7_9METZ|nr:E3 ubiquitin/ISG15 ligase TRIM25-like [Oopsacas minuta]